MFYNKSKSNNRGDEGCYLVANLSIYKKLMNFLSIFKIYGVAIGVPLGLILSCIGISCLCNCAGIIYYFCKRPGQFDAYHISAEINLHRISKKLDSKDGVIDQCVEQP